MAEITIQWPGKSGRKYKYWIYEIGQSLKAEPGNYIFAKETSPDKWTPVYIGETQDLSERFDNHHKMACIRQHGGTHICVHTSGSSRAARQAEEDDLISYWNPPCND